jgi:hypothetical protein
MSQDKSNICFNEPTDCQDLKISWCIDRRPNNEIYKDILFERNENRLRVPEFPIYINVTKDILIEDDNQNCCICMEIREKHDIAVLNCNHSFCGVCVRSLMKNCISKNDPRCPMCREELEYILVNNYKLKFIMTEGNLCL